MRNHNNSIPRNLYISLDPLTANIYRRLKRTQRILGIDLVEAAMGDVVG